METSTPHGSPMRRKLSSRHDLILIDENEQDIENELRNRRLEVINKSAEVRRRSAAAPLLAGLNSNQLAEHCKDCIKLSTENKINSKNAFNFLLIDFMAAMTKKSDSEISKNFQVASCTLDASVKIYGYRVDAVHTEAVKIAGGFIGKELDAMDDNNEDDEVCPDKPEGKQKPKKRKKKMNIVPPHTLNVKSESEALMDMRPSLNILSKHADGMSLLTRVPKHNDECSLVVTPDAPCWPFDSEAVIDNSQTSGKFDPTELMSIFNSIDIGPGDQLCAAASAIEFGKDLGDDPPSELDLSQTSNYEFDVNASVVNLSQEEPMDLGEAPAKLSVPCTGYDSGDEIALPCKPLKGAHQAALSDMKHKLSANTMEYSMFDEKLFKAWAGPTYWRVRPTRLVEDNKENEDASKPVASKRTRRGKLKEVVGLYEIDFETVAKQLDVSDKTVLAKSTLSNWKSSSVTLAEDYKYSPKQLFTLFNLPLSIVPPKKETSVLEDVLENNEEDDTPGEELQYCSQILEDDFQADEGDDGNKSVHEIEAWDAENMLAAPNKVQKIAVGSFQRKKYVDIKHLKRCIWNVLTDTVGKEVAEDNTGHVNDPKSFSTLLNICPSKLPGNVTGCLNAPLMFNALLHLTNEKSLVLKQNEKGADFEISQ